MLKERSESNGDLSHFEVNREMEMIEVILPAVDDCPEVITTERQLYSDDTDD